VHLRDRLVRMTPSSNGKSLSNNVSVGLYRLKACQDQWKLWSSLSLYFTTVVWSLVSSDVTVPLYYLRSVVKKKPEPVEAFSFTGHHAPFLFP
jgi:hypothetical protein